MLAKSCKDCEAMMLGICPKHHVSSTKRAIPEYLVESGKSFIYTRNNNSPGILPWRTPEITGRRVDKVLLILTICDLFDR